MPVQPLKNQKGSVSSVVRKLDGIVPIIPVPFNADESINEGDLKRAVQFAGKNGATGLCLPAYGSEFYKLNDSERARVVTVAIEANAGVVPLIAQANHASASVAAATARRYQAAGADLISIAVPRQFGLRDLDVLRYLGRVADAIEIPLLVQDFNPGGPTIGADEVFELNRQHGNFNYAKLEEPLMADKVVAVRDRVGDSVGILEGWGGMYMLELIPLGICGAMPGLPLLEPLAKVYRLRKDGNASEAMSLMGQLLPFINYTLQNFEVFLHTEKRLLVKRGIFSSASVRDATYTLSKANSDYVDLLCDYILDVIRRSSSAAPG